MILYAAILIIAFLIVVYLTSSSKGEFHDLFKASLKGSRTYSTIESDISDSALKYMNKYYDDEVGMGTITVTTDNLIKYGIMYESDFATADDSCKGYALVKKDASKNLVANAFITCSEYETENYQSWRLGN